MSITITDGKTYTTSNNTVIWNNQAQASVSFFFRYELNGSTSNSVVNGNYIVGRASGFSFVFILRGGSGAGNIGVDCGTQTVNNNSDGGVILHQLSAGSGYHIALTFDTVSNGQTIWINGLSNVFWSCSVNTQDVNAGFQIGGTPPGSPCVFTVSDVATWNGYVLTGTDVANLRDGIQTPAQIGATATMRGRWTLAGTTGNTPTLGDAGLANDYGDATYNLTSIAGSGTAVYSPPIIVEASAGIKTAYVSTSGKKVFVFFKALNSGADTLPINSLIVPTISKNGQNLGQLINPWVTGYHSCVGYDFPAGTSAVPGDAVALTAPIAWVNTVAGITEQISNRAIENRIGRSAVGTDSLRKTFKVGLNHSEVGTFVSTRYHVTKNWRYRLSRWDFATNTSDNYPVTTNNTSTRSTIYDDGSQNRLDSTMMPGPIGLFAISWDDLNPSIPTTLYITTDVPSTTIVTELTNLRNSGTFDSGTGHQVGVTYVFSVERNPTAPSTNTNVRVGVENANGAPQFTNLWIVHETDFSYDSNGQVVIDRSDPYALASVYRDRLKNGIGSARWLDATINYGGMTNVTEPEELRNSTDFSWGMNSYKTYQYIGYVEARPFVPSASTYFYSTFLGSPFNATLALPISTTPASGTQETYGPGYFTNAIAAPIIAGLTLTMPSGEIMRVMSVSGTDPNATVVVARGAENTTVATQAAATIQVNNRLAITSLSQIGRDRDQITELVTQDPHQLKSGMFPGYGGSIAWPTFTYTDGSTMNIGGTNRSIMVTGANTFVISFGAGNSGVSTLTSTVSLGSSTYYTELFLPDMGFPFEFIAKATGEISGCDIQVNIPTIASNTLIDEIARRIRDNFPAGRNVWIEVCDEPWNLFYWQYVTFQWMNLVAYPSQNQYTWWTIRSGQICQRFRDQFNEGGRNRGSEIKCLINVQFGDIAQGTSVLSIAANNNIPMGGVAVAPYIEPDNSTASQTAWDAADDEQAIDLYIHDLYYNATGGGSFANQMLAHANTVNTHNANTGDQCVLYGYEGGLQLAVPAWASNLLTRTRDLAYNPNWRIFEQDFYALLQTHGFARLNLYSYSIYYQLSYNWGLYHWPLQPHGQGDGSDGKADNRLCLACPGKPNTKTSTTNQDLQNVSVRGQALIDWMRSTSPPRKSKAFLRRHP